MTDELNKLREALRRVKHEAASLADAQVIALEALTQRPAAQAGEMDERDRLKTDLHIATDDAAQMLESTQALRAERDTLRAEVQTMGKAISDFCYGNRWAVDAWKNQSYIKPLFDIDTARKATQ